MGSLLGGTKKQSKKSTARAKPLTKKSAVAPDRSDMKEKLRVLVKVIRSSGKTHPPEFYVKQILEIVDG